MLSKNPGFHPKLAWIGILFAALVGGCGGSNGVSVNPPSQPPSATPRNVTISWAQNRESAVNRAGGGYRVYYSTTAGFSLSNGTQISVPYLSGSAAPTSTTVSLVPGTYYVRVVAYSNLNTTGSAASVELQVVVPN